MSRAMVRAILEGWKTQTRRIIKPQPVEYDFGCGRVVPAFTKELHRGMHPGMLAIGIRAFNNGETHEFCPYGHVGDRLWVKETFKTVPVGRHIVYRADTAITNAEKVDHAFGPWKPSIFMPRLASRITLEIVRVRVERLQDISEDDALAEGVQPYTPNVTGMLNNREQELPSNAYMELWDSINGPGSWAVNPWVWVIEFKKL